MKLKRISEKAPQEEFVKIGQLVQKRLVEYKCYSVEGNTGYFYYEDFGE